MASLWHRTAERQLQLYEQGMSQLDGVEKKSRHQSDPSRAIDIAPYPIDWNDLGRFQYLAGFVLAIAEMNDIKLRWGFDWDMDGDFRDQKFYDAPHFELIGE